MKTIEKIELIKKMKIYEQKFGFDEKLISAQEKIALADDEEMKKLFAEYIQGADKEFLFEKRMTVEEATKKAEDEEEIENFLGPIALGGDPVDEEIDKPVFVDNLSPVSEEEKKAKVFETFLSPATNKDKWEGERGKAPVDNGGFVLTADEFENDDQYTLTSSSDEFVSDADRYEDSIETRKINSLSEEERAKKASDIVARMGGAEKDEKPVEEEKKPEPVKKYTASEKESKSGSTLKAVLVAALMGFIGCGVFALVYFLGFISGWVAFLTIFLAGFAYKKVKGEMDKKGYVAITIITIVEMVLALLICYSIWLVDFFTLSGLIEGVKFIFTEMMEYTDMKTAFITDFVMTIGFSIVGVVIYLISQKGKKKG